MCFGLQKSGRVFTKKNETTSSNGAHTRGFRPFAQKIHQKHEWRDRARRQLAAARARCRTRAGLAPGGVTKTLPDAPGRSRTLPGGAGRRTRARCFRRRRNRLVTSDAVRTRPPDFDSESDAAPGLLRSVRAWRRQGRRWKAAAPGSGQRSGCGSSARPGVDRHPGASRPALDRQSKAYGLTASAKVHNQLKDVTIAAAFAAPVAETVPREQSGAPAARIAEQSGPAAA